MPFCRSLLIFFAVASVCWADHEIRTLSGETIKGTIVELSNEEVAVNEDGEIRKVPIAQILSVSMRPVKEPSADTKYILVQLYDESRLLCKSAALKGDKAHLELLSGPKIVVPLENLTGLLRDAQNEKLRTQFDKLLSEPIRSDRLLALRNDELNPVEGAFGDVDPNGEKVQFRPDALGVVRDFALDKLQGMIWHRIRTPGKAPICLVVDTVGNTLAAKEISVKGDTFFVTIPTGDKIEFAESALAKLDYNRGKLTFLSDLKPSDTKFKSGLGFSEGFLFRTDRTLENQPIMIGKTNYDKGLALHAHYEVEYELAGKFKEFKADLGADNRAPLESKALVIVRCDGVEVLRQQVDMNKVIPINLNVKNVNKLRIIVTSRNDGSLISRFDSDDRAILANARIIQ